MTDQQSILLENHKDCAQLACTGEHNCFWVLDLTDPKAFRIAEQFDDRKRLVTRCIACIENNQIPAQTLATPLAHLNIYRVTIMGSPPLPTPKPGFLYIAVFTEGRVLVAMHPTLIGPIPNS
jgi:hypothetical protein